MSRVTGRMVNAATRVLYESGLIEAGREYPSDRLVVSEMLSAACEASVHQRGNRSGRRRASGKTAPGQVSV